MSARNVRKLFGDNTLPPPDGDSDGDYEPLYTRSSPSKFKYEGLGLSSHSESEHDSSDAADAVGKDDPVLEEVSKKKKKNKKKLRKSKHKEIPGSSQDSLKMDEIDKCLMEVNAMLGPLPTPSISSEKPKDEPAQDLMTVQQKHLNVSNELRRMFGPDGVDPENKRRGRQHNLNRILKKAILVPSAENAPYLQKVGLSMSVHRRENGYTYFVYEHSRAYQRQHLGYLGHFSFYYQRNDEIVAVEEAKNLVHVEGLLENADSMFRIEEFSSANALVEKAVAYMQHVAHPSFNLTDRKTRLEYKHIENRAFHVGVLKYLYLLTNRACHRTALELAKLLLNLDPSDPLAVLFIIDCLALRAREHQWLIQAVDYWSVERDAGFLFNMQYSYAMAHYHVATKSKGDISKADNLLQNAMLRFPAVVIQIMQCANFTPSARLLSHALFKTTPNETTGKNLMDLIHLYAKFTWSKWRENDVFEWLKRNANELADKYDQSKEVQERARGFANEQLNLFRGWPEEMVRHLTVIKPMATLLVDGAVPRMGRGLACDPVPPIAGASRYGYDLVASQAAAGSSNSALYELFSSLMPNYDNAGPAELERDVRRRQALALAELYGAQNDAGGAPPPPAPPALEPAPAPAPAQAQALARDGEAPDLADVEELDMLTEAELNARGILRGTAANFFRTVDALMYSLQYGNNREENHPNPQRERPDDEQEDLSEEER